MESTHSLMNLTRESYLRYKSDYLKIKTMMIGGFSPAYEAMVYNIPNPNVDHALKAITYPSEIVKTKKSRVSKKVIDEFNENLKFAQLRDVFGEINEETVIDTTQGISEPGILGVTNLVEYGIRTGAEGKDRVLIFTGTVEGSTEIILGSITVVNNIPVQKRFYFYPKYTSNTVPIIVTKTTFLDGDETFLLGDVDDRYLLSCGAMIELRFTISSSKSDAKLRELAMTVRKITFPGSDGYEIPTNITVNHINNIVVLLRSLNTSYAKPEYGHCQKALDTAPSEFKKYPKVYQNVVSTICNNIYYHYPPSAITSIMKTPTILQIITAEELNKILPIIKTWDDNAFENHLMDIPKLLPSTIENKHISFKNGKGVFVTLSTPMRVIFDSGNSTVTSIGRDIVKELGLEVTEGCMMISVGVGGKNKTCGDYVSLSFKFNPSFPNGTQKEYQILAFVDDATLKDTVLFGHANGLDLLFNDNYSIKGEYSKSDPRSKHSEQDRRQIIDSHMKLNHILDAYLENPKENKEALLRLDSVPVNRIHAYRSGINEDNFAGTFEKLNEINKLINADPAFRTLPFAVVKQHLNSLMKNE